MLGAMKHAFFVLSLQASVAVAVMIKEHDKGSYTPAETKKPPTCPKGFPIQGMDGCCRWHKTPPKCDGKSSMACAESLCKKGTGAAWQLWKPNPEKGAVMNVCCNGDMLQAKESSKGISKSSGSWSVVRGPKDEEDATKAPYVLLVCFVAVTVFFAARNLQLPGLNQKGLTGTAAAAAKAASEKAAAAKAARAQGLPAAAARDLAWVASHAKEPLITSAIIEAAAAENFVDEPQPAESVACDLVTDKEPSVEMTFLD